MRPDRHFDFTAVLNRLLEEAYRLLAALPLLILALFIVWVSWLLGGWLSRRQVLGRVATKNPFLADLTRTTARWIVVLAGTLVALEILDATSLVGAVLGTAGVLGVALGFAFKDILENYLAGILMSLRQPFAPRDHVVINGNEGIVLALTSRATVLMTLDGNHLRLPNAMVFSSVMLNYTRNPTRRFQFEVGIGVGEDLVRAQRIGVRELGQLNGVIANPPPRAFINALGDSNVQVLFQGWVDQASHDFLLTRSEAIRKVKLALEAAGMDMPEPIYRVQMSQTTMPDKTPTPAEPMDEAPVDTRAQSDLQSQIDRDRQTSASTDLLNPTAPRE